MTIEFVLDKLKKLKVTELKNIVKDNNLIKYKSLKKKNDYIECIMYNKKYYDGTEEKPKYIDKGQIIKEEKTVLYDTNYDVVGIDEAGAGSMVSGCYIASVILPKSNPYPDDIYMTSLWNSLNDSKKVSYNKRLVLYEYVKKIAVEYNVEIVGNEEIDEINIRQARLVGFHRTLDRLKSNFNMILVDGDMFNDYYKNNEKIPHKCVIEGDGIYKNIAAASILAKTQRDLDIKELHKEYPMYKWDSNYGYCTREHEDLVRKYGITKYHRKTYGVCKSWKKYNNINLE